MLFEQNRSAVASGAGQKTDPEPYVAGAPSADPGGPVASADPAVARTRAKSAVPTHLLLAEDDHEFRRSLASALRREGYVVAEASDGDEALRKVQGSQLCDDAGPPLDAVISDVRMPARSGVDVLLAVRALDPALPVVLVTAFGDPEVHMEARWMGADAVLDKPFDVDDLRAVLGRMAPPV